MDHTPMKLTEELLRQAALASLKNALSLHESATLLAHKSPGFNNLLTLCGIRHKIQAGIGYTETHPGPTPEKLEGTTWLRLISNGSFRPCSPSCLHVPLPRASSGTKFVGTEGGKSVLAVWRCVMIVLALNSLPGGKALCSKPV